MQFFYVRPDPDTFAPTNRPKDPMTMDQLNNWYDRIILGNLCKKCDSDFAEDGQKYCPNCKPEIEVSKQGLMFDRQLEDFDFS